MRKKTRVIGLSLIAIVLYSTIVLGSALIQDTDYIHAIIKKSGPQDYWIFGPYYANSIRVRITDTNPEGCVTWVIIKDAGGELYSEHVDEDSGTGYVETGGTQIGVWVWLCYAYDEGNPLVYDTYAAVDTI